MRTLKKVLALTVVLATLLSISAFAAFSDEESINENFVDAVNLLGALNVMTGDTEGTFRPNDTISRAEAAKMIYVIRNGGVDDKAAGWTGMTTFSDVASGVWYEGYVNYCASLGIIAGIGGGKFNPSGAVTGVELAKMMLVVADYRPDIEQYTGTGWNLNVIRDAQSAGMFEGYTLAYSAAATRQQAAQLFSNAILDTEMAVYIGDVRLNSAAGIGQAETVGNRFFDLETATGVIENVAHVDLDITDGGTSTLNPNNDEVEIDVTSTSLSGTGSYTGPKTFVFDVDSELLYQEVEVIYQEHDKHDGLDKDDKIYDVMATGRSRVYETTMDAITLALTDNTKAVDLDDNPITIKFDGYNSGRAKAIGEKGLPVVTNLYDTTVIKDSEQSSTDSTKYVVKDADVLALKSAAAVRLVDTTNDGVLDVAFVTAPIYGTVSSYNADRYDFATNARFDGDRITSDRDEDLFANFTFEDDLVRGDVIAVTVDVLSGEVLYNVALVEPVVGELTEVQSTGDDNKITVDGAAYGFSGGLFDNKDVTIKASDYTSDIGEELTLYTDGKYILSATSGSGKDVGTNYAYVYEYSDKAVSSDGMHSDVIKFRMKLADGKDVLWDYVDKADSDTAKYWDLYDEADDDAPRSNVGDFFGQIVRYTNSGNEVTFYKSEPDTDDEIKASFGTTGDSTFNSKSGLFTVGSTSMRVDENSVFFLPVLDDEDDGFVNKNVASVTLIHGDELQSNSVKLDKAEDANNQIMTLVSSLKNGINTIAFGALNVESKVGNASLYAYTLSNSRTARVDGSTETVVDVVLSTSADAEKQTIVLSSDTAILANKLYKVTVENDGDYTLEQVKRGVDNVVLDAVTSDHNTSTVGTENNGVFFFDEDKTVVFYVDGDTIEPGVIDRASMDDDDKYFTNVVFEHDGTDDKVLNVVYVQLDGEDVSDIITYTDDEAELLVEDVKDALTNELKDIKLPDAPDAAGSESVEVPENDVIASIKVDYVEGTDSAIVPGTVTVTFTEEYQEQIKELSEDQIKAIVEALAEKLGMEVQDGIEIDGLAAAALALFAAEPEATESSNLVITEATVTEDGELVLTIGEATEEPEGPTTVSSVEIALSALTDEMTFGSEGTAPQATESVEGVAAETTWYSDEYSTEADGTASAGSTYYVKVTLTADEGYALDLEEMTGYTLSTETTEAGYTEASVEVEGSNIVIKTSFTLEPAEDPKTEIESIALTVTGQIETNDSLLSGLTFAVDEEQVEDTALSVQWNDEATNFSTVPVTGTVKLTISESAVATHEWGEKVTVTGVKNNCTGSVAETFEITAEAGLVSDGKLTVTITIANVE